MCCSQLHGVGLGNLPFVLDRVQVPLPRSAKHIAQTPLTGAFVLSHMQIGQMQNP